KHDPQIALHFHRVNRLAPCCRELVDFVGAQSGIKWIALEDLPCRLDRQLLTRGQLLEIPPELWCRLVSVALHTGGLSKCLSCISMALPSSTSSVASQKSSGMCGCSKRRMTRPI